MISTSTPSNLNTGTLNLANDVTVDGTFTNQATLVLADDTEVRHITGLTSALAFRQLSNGDLVIAVSPTGTAELDVTGSASLAGEVTFDYAPGTYKNDTFTFLEASGGLGGSQFTTVAAGAGNLGRPHRLQPERHLQRRRRRPTSAISWRVGRVSWCCITPC